MQNDFWYVAAELKTSPIMVQYSGWMTGLLGGTGFWGTNRKKIRLVNWKFYKRNENLNICYVKVRQSRDKRFKLKLAIFVDKFTNAPWQLITFCRTFNECSLNFTDCGAVAVLSAFEEYGVDWSFGAFFGSKTKQSCSSVRWINSIKLHSVAFTVFPSFCVIFKLIN